MRISTTVGPGTGPRPIIDQDRVFAPTETGLAPAPGCKVSSDHSSWAEADRAAHEESRTRPRVHYVRIINRNIDVPRSCGDNLDIPRTGDHRLLILVAP